jgi:hypothetical protein
VEISSIPAQTTSTIIFLIFSTVKKWTMDGNEVDLYHGHEGFVFTILVNNDFLFSAGDDAVVNIWQGKNVLLHKF